MNREQVIRLRGLDPGHVLRRPYVSLPSAPFALRRTGAKTFTIGNGYAYLADHETQIVDSYSYRTLSAAGTYLVYVRLEFVLGSPATFWNALWHLPGVTSSQTYAQLSAGGYRVFVLGRVTATTGGAITDISQAQHGPLVFSVLPGDDLVGDLGATTLPPGWVFDTAAGGRFPVGYIAGNADYGTIRNTGGVGNHSHDSHTWPDNHGQSGEAASGSGAGPFVDDPIHDGGDPDHSLADHRPPWIVYAKVKWVGFANASYDNANP